MKSILSILLFSTFTFIVTLPCIAQDDDLMEDESTESLEFDEDGKTKKKKKKKKKERKIGDIQVQDFAPTSTASALYLPELTFPNINMIPYYANKSHLAQITRFEKNQQYEEMEHALIDYITNFGIQNFYSDMSLVWKLARVAERNEKLKLAKEVYRLIIKHYRGDIHQALHHYKELAGEEDPKYVSLDYYYQLVEKRRLIDTLKPPQDVLLDMGEEVNSIFEDYGLTIGSDDKTIYFTSKRNNDTAHVHSDLISNYNEDIYYSEQDEDGYWTPAQPFKQINSQYNEGSPCMSKDKKAIYFSRCNSPKGLGNCDIYVSYKFENADGEEVWSEAYNMGKNINSYSWDSHPALSQTGDTLYFASDRKGGFGGSDIYFCVKRGYHKWSKAYNLGPIINTQASEVSPYPHPKHNVLYFSSNGHLLNYGDFDIFKAYQINDLWSEPKNVGPLVNGKGSEFYFSIDSKSEHLFYAKSKESNVQDLDLHSFPLPMEAQPNATVRFSGKVIEPTTGEVFQGVVTVIDVKDGIEVMPKYLDEEGKFEFELIDEKKYLLVIEGDNFFKIKEMFYVDGETEVNIPAVSMHSNLTFKSIDFDPNSTSLKHEMENDLHLIIDFLTEHPMYKVQVVGHTDSDGSPDFNFELSQKRADVIRDYIISYGNFEENRVEAIGKGDTEPLIPDEVTEEHKRMNRRVEFKISQLGEYNGSKSEPEISKDEEEEIQQSIEEEVDENSSEDDSW